MVLTFCLDLPFLLTSILPGIYMSSPFYRSYWMLVRSNGTTFLHPSYNTKSILWGGVMNRLLDKLVAKAGNNQIITIKRLWKLQNMFIKAYNNIKINVKYFSFWPLTQSCYPIPQAYNCYNMDIHIRANYQD